MCLIAILNAAVRTHGVAIKVLTCADGVLAFATRAGSIASSTGRRLSKQSHDASRCDVSLRPLRAQCEAAAKRVARMAQPHDRKSIG
jgi:hypothetical protein